MSDDPLNPPIITSDRDCPVCGGPVHWTRYWLRAWIWAKWPCPRCGSLLGFNRNRRMLYALAGAIAGGIFGTLRFHYGWLVGLAFIVAATALLQLIENVIVLGNRNPRYCSSCRYDLSGTIDAGINRCPECGRPIDNATIVATPQERLRESASQRLG